MRLYRIDRYSQPGSIWAGTQADAKQAVKQTGKTFEAVEVPTDKAGLIAFLNFEGRVATDIGDINGALALETTERLPAPPMSNAPLTYQSPLSAASCIANIDAGMCSAAIRQMDGTNLAKIVTASIERLAQLNGAAS